MRFFIRIFFTVFLFAFGTDCFAQVQVKGYYRKDGTYVSPHVRSSPDAYKWNNYGPSSSSPEYTGKGHVTSPYTRDIDRDGIANLFDYDDNNDGIHDDANSSSVGTATHGSFKAYKSNGIISPPQAGVITSYTPSISKSKTSRNYSSCLMSDYGCDYNSLTVEQLASVKEASLRRNYNTCLMSDYGCDYNTLTHEQTVSVKEASLRRNFNTCSMSDYGCDYNSLTDEQTASVKEASLRRNYNTCLMSDYGCDYNSLTVEQTTSVKEASLRRNYNTCLMSDYGCDYSSLTVKQTASVKEASLRRNYNTCLMSHYGCDYTRLTDRQRTSVKKRRN